MNHRLIHDDEGIYQLEGDNLCFNTGDMLDLCGDDGIIIKRLMVREKEDDSADCYDCPYVYDECPNIYTFTKCVYKPLCYCITDDRGYFVDLNNVMESV